MTSAETLTSQVVDSTVLTSESRPANEPPAGERTKLVFAHASHSQPDLAPTAASKKRSGNPFKGLVVWRRKSETPTPLAEASPGSETIVERTQQATEGAAEGSKAADQTVPFPTAAPRAARRVSFSPSVEEAAAGRELESSSESAKAARKAAKAEKARRKVEKRAKREEARARKEEDEKAAKGQEVAVDLSHRQAQVESKQKLPSSKNASNTEQRENGGQRDHRQDARPRRTSSFSVDRRGIHIAPQLNPNRETPSKDAKSTPSRPRTSKQAALCARHARALEKVILATNVHAPSQKAKNQGPGVVDAKQMRALKRALLDQHLANGIIGELRAMHLGSAAGVGLPADRIIAGDADLLGRGDLSQTPDHNKAMKDRAAPSAAFSALERVASVHDEARVQQTSDAKTDDALTATPASPNITAMTRFRSRLSSSGPRPATVQKALSRDPHAQHKQAAAENSAGAAATVDHEATTKRPVKAVWLECPECEAVERHIVAITSPPAAVEPPSAPEPQEAKNSLAAAGFAIWGARLWFTSGAVSEGSTAERAPEEKAAFTTPTSAEDEKGAVRAADAAVVESDPRVLLSGGLLAGVSPVSLLLSPGPTAINAAGRASGAFDALGAMTAAAVRADAGGIDAMGQVRPPLDRCAIFVHWWGFEITMPPPTMNYLSTAHSISGAFLSFLQTMVVSGGVPELLPFVKYISQFVEMEFTAIKSQNRGNGVIVAATFLMPFALVPRPWDYSTERLPLPPPTTPDASPGPARRPLAPKRTSSAPTQVLLPLSAFPVVSSQQAAFAIQSAQTTRRGSASPQRRSPSPSRRSEAAVAAATKEGLTPPPTPRASFQLPPGLKLDALAELPEGSIRIASKA